MTVVVDASVVVTMLVGRGFVGQWAESLLTSGPPAAPHLMPVEATNVLRRMVVARELSDDVALLAGGDLAVLPVHLFPYAPFASRVWELRHSVTPYDAWYVALAEILDAPLATLDGRLRRAPGLRCEVLTPSLSV